MLLDNFIAFEGIDGTGTSTQLKLLSQRPEHEHFFITAEPTTNETGKFIRQVLGGHIKVHHDTITYLFAADRNEHLYSPNGIIDNLHRNKIVLTDRYLFSNLAYQSILGGKDLPAYLNASFPLPKLVFFFDLEPRIALDRIQKRGNDKEIYEKVDFLTQVSNAYHSLFEEYKVKTPDMQIVHIDASNSIEKTAQIIWSYITKLPILKK
ncbi:MAG: dTMP kinase [Treponema sp.]|nr:dTMP kinase [Treponema sp.]